MKHMFDLFQIFCSFFDFFSRPTFSFPLPVFSLIIPFRTFHLQHSNALSIQSRFCITSIVAVSFLDFIQTRSYYLYHENICASFTIWYGKMINTFKLLSATCIAKESRALLAFVEMRLSSRNLPHHPSFHGMGTTECMFIYHPGRTMSSASSVV